MNTRTLTSKFVAFVVAIGLSIPMSVYASPEKAAQFYEQATQAYQDGDLRKAADLLERAFAQDNDLVYQYNRILALEGLKEYDESLRVLSIYEEPMMKDSQNRFSDVAQIKARLIEGQKANQEELAKNKADEEKRAQEEKEQALRDEEERKRKADEAKPTESSTNWGAISLIAGGGAALVVGTLFGSGTFITGYDEAKCISNNLPGNSFEDALSKCETDKEFENVKNANDYREVIDTQGTHQMVAISLWTIGGLAVGGGIWWLLSSDSKSDRRATLAPVLLKGGAGAVFQFGF